MNYAKINRLLVQLAWVFGILTLLAAVDLGVSIYRDPYAPRNLTPLVASAPLLRTTSDDAVSVTNSGRDRHFAHGHRHAPRSHRVPRP